MNFKVHYRKLLLQYVLAKIDECATASDVAKSINVLAAMPKHGLQLEKNNHPQVLPKGWYFGCYLECCLL